MKKREHLHKDINRGYTIGRDAFAKISAVEGIYLTKEMRNDFRAFEQVGLSHTARRETILKKYVH